MFAKHIKRSMDNAEGSNSTCFIKIQKFLSTWWISRVLKRSGSSKQEAYDENETEQNEEADDHLALFVDENTLKPKLSVKVNVHLMLKWIRGEISQHESKFRGIIKKVIILIEEEEDLIHMVELTEVLKSAMVKHSLKPEIKEEILETEKFSSEEPCWPQRWYIHIQWKNLTLPKEMSKLQHVEVIDTSRHGNYVDRMTELPDFIGLFKDLKVLNIVGNCIKTIPSSLQLCKKLEEFLASNCQLSFLPGFLLNLPNLKRIARHDNCFYNFREPKDGSIEEPDSTDVQNIGDNSPTVFHCDSLCRISSMSIASNIIQCYNIHDIAMLDIPRTLQETVYETFCEMSLCNCCGKPVSRRDGWIYSIMVDSFMGYTQIPIRGTTCSHRCAMYAREKVLNMNKVYEAKKGEIEYCYDVKVEDWIVNKDNKSVKQPGRWKRSRIYRLWKRIR